MVVQRLPSLDCADDFIQVRKTVSWLEPRTHQSTGKTSEIVKERLWFYSSYCGRQDFARDYICLVFNRVQLVHSWGARKLCSRGAATRKRRDGTALRETRLPAHPSSLNPVSMRVRKHLRRLHARSMRLGRHPALDNYFASGVDVQI